MLDHNVTRSELSREIQLAPNEKYKNTFETKINERRDGGYKISIPRNLSDLVRFDEFIFFPPPLFFRPSTRSSTHTHTHTGVRVYICEPNRRISRYKITRPQGYPELIEQERGKTFGSCGYRKEIKTVVSGLPPPFLLCMQPLHLSAHHALRIARISGSFFSSFSLSLSLSR